MANLTDTIGMWVWFCAGVVFFVGLLIPLLRRLAGWGERTKWLLSWTLIVPGILDDFGGQGASRTGWSKQVYRGAWVSYFASFLILPVGFGIFLHALLDGPGAPSLMIWLVPTLALGTLLAYLALWMWAMATGK